jgi:hypothetical protein
VRYSKLLRGRSSFYSVRHAAILPRVEQILKPAYRQALISQPSVKTLDPRILRRFSWLNSDVDAACSARNVWSGRELPRKHQQTKSVLKS